MSKKKNKSKEKSAQNLKRTIKTTKYMLRFVWQSEKGKSFLIVKFILALFNALYPIIFTVFPGLIINELTSDKQLDKLILYVCVLTIAPVLVHVSLSFIGRYIEKISMTINLDITKRFYDHYICMDYESVENPEIGIMQERAQATFNSTLQIVNDLCGLFGAIIGLIAISSIISTINPILVVLVVVITLINSFITRVINEKKYKIGKEMSEVERYQSSANYMLYMIIYAKEIRLFNLKNYLMEHYEKYVLEHNKLRLKSDTVGMIPGMAASLLNFVQQVVMYAYLFVSILKYELQIGSMTIYLAAVGQLSGALNGIFAFYQSLSKISLNVQETIEFMNIPLKQYKTGDKTPIINSDSVIEFKNVSFKYPGSQTYAIKNMSIKIFCNEKLCIVGTNGSGKSTFIKLLARLYCPTEGEILLNGINIYEYDYRKYQRLFSPVFQDFCGYFMSLKENIVLNHEYDQKKLDQICNKCGLTSLLSNLAKGYDTQIGKWIDDEGIQPSGGEFQKIAIARALYNDAPMFLLDEPTAALDPLIEYEIYKQFNEIITNKSAILITHRLSAVQLADKVAVFENGKLIEYGTHKQLYDKGDKYAEMFNKQAHFYRDDSKCIAN